MPRHQSQFGNRRWVEFVNVASESIPPHAVIAITDHVERFEGDKPADGKDKYAANGLVAVPQNSHGDCTFDWPAVVRVESGTPKNGDTWGPVDSWGLQEDGKGFCVLGYNAEQNLALVVLESQTSVKFPAALIDRSLDRYSFIEMDPTGGWHPKENGRCGLLNASSFNGQQHNCQGGVHPEIVLMWSAKDVGWGSSGSESGTPTTGSRELSGATNDFCGLDTSGSWTGEAEYYFEYAVGPNEERSERFQYQIGLEWKRNDAGFHPNGQPVKGVLFQSVVVSS